MRKASFLILLLSLFATMSYGRDFYPQAEQAYYESRYSEAIIIALEGVSQPDITEEDAVELYSILGSSYARLGDFDKAADYMIRCYEWDKAQGEKKGLTSSLINLASMYVSAGKAGLAVNYALEAISNEEQVGRPDKLAMAYGKACDVFHSTGQDSTALGYANLAVAIADKDLDDMARAIRRSQRAYALEGLGRYGEALSDLSFAEKVFREKDVKQSLAIVCFQLGQEYGRQKNALAQRRYLGEAAALAREVKDYPLLEKICNTMSQALKNSDPAQALLYLEESMALKDSIAKRKSSNVMELFNVEYETVRREQTIEIQRIELAREKKRKRTLMVLVLLLVGGAAITAVFALRIRRERKKLRESNSQKDFLFKVISHDIQAPAVAQLRGMQMLRAYGTGMSPEELGTVFLQLERQAESEVELIDNVLKWARKKTGELEPVRFALDDLAGEVVSQYSDSAKSKGISLRVESPGEVVVCSVRSNLILALRNIVSNALKFSSAGSSVTIRIEPQDKGAILSVIDHGIGIPVDKLQTIFEAGSSFRRSGTDGEPSNGLGLAVTRDLVEEISSSISVESKEGEGSCFAIRINNLLDNA